MSFIHPFYLWGLAGLGIPVLIHFFARREGKTLEFSSLQFLKISRTKTGKIQNLQELLILLLRMALLTLLVFVLAGPTNKSSSLFRKGDLIVFLLDDSFSMSSENGTPWKNLQKSSLKMLSSIKKPAKVAVVFLSGKEVPFSQNFAEIARTIRKSRISQVPGNLPLALKKALSILKNKDKNKTIYLYTDLQKNLWKNFPKQKINLGEVKMVIVNIGSKNTNNLCLEKIEPLGENRYNCELRNWSGKETTGEIFLNGNKLAQDKSCDYQVAATFRLRKNNFKEILLSLPGNFATLEGKIVAADNNIKLDDYFYLDLAPENIEKVLIISGNPQAPVYLENALQAIKSSGTGFEIELRKPDEVAAIPFASYQVIFLSDVGRLKIETIKKLYSYLQDGGNLVNFLGSRVSPVNFNSDWMLREKNIFLMPAKLEKKIDYRKPTRIVWLNMSSPIFNPFKEGIHQYLRSISFEKVFQTKEVSGDVLAKLENNIPLLLKKKIGMGKVLLFTFSPEESWTNFPFKPFFPVMIKTTLDYLTKNKSPFITVGKKIALTVPPGVRKIEIVSPSGERRVIKGCGQKVEFRADKAGFWKMIFFDKKGEKEKIIAANADWKEGNLEKIGFWKIKTMLQGNVRYEEGKNMGDFLAEKVKSSDLSNLFLGLAFLALLLEMGISNFFDYRKTKNV